MNKMKKANRFRVGTVLQYQKGHPFAEKVVTKVAPNAWVLLSTKLNTKRYAADEWINTLALSGSLTVVHDNGKVKA